MLTVGRAQKQASAETTTLTDLFSKSTVKDLMTISKKVEYIYDTIYTNFAGTG